MKQNSLLRYALAGIANGLIASALTALPTHLQGSESGQAVHDGDFTDKNAENEGYHLMSEDELKGLLNKKSSALFDSLDADGKTLAIQVASGRCDGTNYCAGLNACESPENSCAGQGTCKGKGKCAFANKNLAVQLVAKKMMEKRKKATSQKH